MAVLGIKSQSIIEELLLFQSQTWTCHQTGLVKVVCIGGGGSGACVTASTNGMAGRATGGGGGGYSDQIIPVTKGDTYTITIGAAGQARARTNNAGNGVTQGQVGGASRFVTASGTTIDLNAGGGGAGVGAINDSSGSEEGLAGGTGGSASGGSTNRVGGAGGAIASGGGRYALAATGGGAVGIRSPVGYAGGAVVPSASNNVGRYHSSGGGGIGGAGGALTSSSLLIQYSATNGGGSSGPGTDDGSGASPVSQGAARMASTAGGTGMIANYGPTQSNIGAVVGTNVGLLIGTAGNAPGTYGTGGMPNSIFSVFGSGGSYIVSGNSLNKEAGAPGGGGGGNAGNRTTLPSGGIFAGGGGNCSNTSSINTTGIGGPMGGGSGGAVNSSSGNATASGVAGTGAVVIQYLSLT